MQNIRNYEDVCCQYPLCCCGLLIVSNSLQPVDYNKPRLLLHFTISQVMLKLMIESVMPSNIEYKLAKPATLVMSSLSISSHNNPSRKVVPTGLSICCFTSLYKHLYWLFGNLEFDLELEGTS